MSALEQANDNSHLKKVEIIDLIGGLVNDKLERQDPPESLDPRQFYKQIEQTNSTMQMVKASDAQEAIHILWLKHLHQEANYGKWENFVVEMVGAASQQLKKCVKHMGMLFILTKERSFRPKRLAFL